MGAAMKSGAGTLVTLAGFFSLLSLFAIGGGNSAVPEMHRYAVDVQHWLTDRQFADTFALAQLTPGPNLIIVALVGFHVAGVLGAVVAMLAMCGPTGVAAYFVGRASERFRGKIWHSAISHGLVPVTIGLIAASATVIATTADYSWRAGALTAATALICYFVRINPIWMFAAAALLGLAGAV
jgi:chromate transporter